MMQLPGAVTTLTKGLLDAFAPARCIDCLAEGTWYCSACRAQQPPTILRCIGCKTERPRGSTCLSCREDTRLTGIISAGNYSSHTLQRGIEWLKFKGVRHVADILGALIIPHLPRIAPLEELSQQAILVPIPLHIRRLRHRGFNQSEDIARAIGKVCNIEVAQLLKRTKPTASQVKIKEEMRAANMEHAFRLAIDMQTYKNLVAHKPIIILIDDVATTGATVSEAAEAFPEVNGIQIWAATVARG